MLVGDGSGLHVAGGVARELGLVGLGRAPILVAMASGLGVGLGRAPILVAVASGLGVRSHGSFGS